MLRHSACSISTGKEAAAAGVTTLHTAAHPTAGDTHEDTALTTLSALVCHCSSQWSPVSAAAPSTGATPLLSLAAAHSKHRLHILQALPAPTLTITGIHHQHIHCIHNRQSPAKNNEVSAEYRSSCKKCTVEKHGAMMTMTMMRVKQNMMFAPRQLNRHLCRCPNDAFQSQLRVNAQ